MAGGDRSGTRLGARFGAHDKVALDETIRKAERVSRVEFSVFVGHAEGDPRSYAVSLHRTLVAPARSILILVDPDARALEVVTGSHVRRTLRDSQVELAVVQMQSLFAEGDLVGGLRRGIQMLAEHARAPQLLHADQ
ncbi:DUF5130 family protein [Nocardioides halotolerans]|uniref:DUF5130 family protein n=1 Tax=Nocardioides halotolerans TaxID=433660 RepID=UPI0004242DEC|nr:DUF5130 family protein [Nocardioides halotolerans]